MIIDCVDSVVDKLKLYNSYQHNYVNYKKVAFCLCFLLVNIIYIIGSKIKILKSTIA